MTLDNFLCLTASLLFVVFTFALPGLLFRDTKVILKLLLLIAVLRRAFPSKVTREGTKLSSCSTILMDKSQHLNKYTTLLGLFKAKFMQNGPFLFLRSKAPSKETSFYFLKTFGTQFPQHSPNSNRVMAVMTPS